MNRIVSHLLVLAGGLLAAAGLWVLLDVVVPPAVIDGNPCATMETWTGVQAQKWIGTRPLFSLIYKSWLTGNYTVDPRVAFGNQVRLMVEMHGEPMRLCVLRPETIKEIVDFRGGNMWEGFWADVMAHEIQQCCTFKERWTKANEKSGRAAFRTVVQVLIGVITGLFVVLYVIELPAQPSSSPPPPPRYVAPAAAAA